MDQNGFPLCDPHNPFYTLLAIWTPVAFVRVKDPRSKLNRDEFKTIDLQNTTIAPGLPGPAANVISRFMLHCGWVSE